MVREISSGMPRANIARNLGINFDVVPNVTIASGIEKTKILISRLWVDESNCRLWLDAIAQYCREWDDEHGMFKDNPRHDWTSHAADVLRYAAVVEPEMKSAYHQDYVQPAYERPGLSADIYRETAYDSSSEFVPHRRI